MSTGVNMAIDATVRDGLLPFYGASYVAAALAVIVIYSSLPDTSRGTIVPGAPVVGRGWSFEPSWLTKLRFTVQGWKISHEGWMKVYPQNRFW